MREILFRGKPLGKLDEDFVYGSLGVISTDLVAIYQCEEYYEDITTLVDIGTVGQYTGLTDKNGKKIFEGDIVHCWGGEYAFGFWEHNNTFAFTNISDYMQMGELSESEFVKVIGNIHDNPELLKGGDE